MKNILAAFVTIGITLVSPKTGFAQNVTHNPPSTCQAVAQHPLPIIKASTTSEMPLQIGEVQISYVGHSTFRIENRGGFTIATDYAGFAGLDVVPDVVTMNHAHGTHFTILT